jgi:protein-tyrosine kinase
MSDGTRPLNLIQRALSRSAESAGGRTNAPQPAEARSAPAPAESHLAPSNQPHKILPPVSLNFAELRRSGMVRPDNKASGIGNEFRAIKRRVIASARDAENGLFRNNLVMVTSSLPKEGKTFTSVNLAISLAMERDLRVLLVDCDMLRPGVARFFGKTRGDGLAEFLKGAMSSIDDVTYRCKDLPNLDVVFAGTPEAESPELVSSRRMSELLVAFANADPDRIVIVDTPPVLASTEAATLAVQVHQLIMVIAALQSDRFQLEKALETVSACRSISLLFNKAPRWRQMAPDNYYYYAEQPRT